MQGTCIGWTLEDIIIEEMKRDKKEKGKKKR